MLKAIKEVAGKIGGAAAKGQMLDMLKIPTPAFIHYKGTHLTLIQNDFIRLDILKHAADATDPIERMKWVITFFIASNYIQSTIANCKVPLNPILGETLQRDMPTGERIFCEQVSHHPPISAFDIYGANDEYRLYGHHQVKGWLTGASSFGGSKTGKAVLEFKDGGKLCFISMPKLCIENIFSKTKKAVFYDNVVIQDEINNIEGIIKYNPNFNQGLSGVAYRHTFGWLPGMNGLGQNKDQGRTARADDVLIEINSRDLSNKKSKPELKAKGFGSWLSHLIIEGQEMWRIE